MHWRVVDRIFKHAPTPILTVEIEQRAIRGTANHPYWVDGKGWTYAAQLRVGDQLLGHDGLLQRVTAIVDNGEIEPVFNIAVAEHHTYFVASGDMTVTALVHNDYVITEQSSGRTLVYYQASIFGYRTDSKVLIGYLEGENVIHVAADGTKTAALLSAVEVEVTSLGTTGDWDQWFSQSSLAKWLEEHPNATYGTPNENEASISAVGTPPPGMANKVTGVLVAPATDTAARTYSAGMGWGGSSSNLPPNSMPSPPPDEHAFGMSVGNKNKAAAIEAVIGVGEAGILATDEVVNGRNSVDFVAFTVGAHAYFYLTTTDGKYIPYSGPYNGAVILSNWLGYGKSLPTTD